MKNQKIKKACEFRHTYCKSSDCPTCPTCEKLKEPVSFFSGLLSNPARTVLLHYGIDTVLKLSSLTEKEILNLHGNGKVSMTMFRKVIDEEGLSFKRKYNS